MPISGQNQNPGTRNAMQRQRQTRRNIAWVGNDTGPYDFLVGPGIPVGYSAPVPVTATATVPAPSVSTSPTNVTISATAISVYALVQFVVPMFPLTQVVQPNQPVLSAKPRGAFYNGFFNEIPFQTPVPGTPPGQTRAPVDNSNAEPVVVNNG